MMPRKQHGVALVLVLWLVGLMTLMAGAFTLTTRRETASVSYLTGQARAEAAAEAGVFWAQVMLSAEEPERWDTDGRPYALTFGDAQLMVRIFAEAGKIDLNHADEWLISQLMTLVELDLASQQALTSAIMDWRDPDDNSRPNGAEREAYLQAGRAQGPGNRPFSTVRELQQVLGMDARLFQQLSPWFTVYSGQAKPTLDLVAEPLRSMLSEAPAEADAPAAPPPPPGTAQSFLDLAQAARSVQQTSGDNTDRAVLTIAVQARMPDGLATTLGTVVKPDQNTQHLYQTLEWRIDAAQDQALFGPELTDYATGYAD
ncbi:MAG: type II secretion system protein GspK [Methylococcales bacterium]|nr:type II secretion system protein GspK [Methylococcales bacterium]